MDLKSKIKALAKGHLDEVIAIRRHLHAHPELSFQEFETSQYVKEILTKEGIPFKGDYVKTGIVALIEGGNPAAKVIALRADLDALPILEENNVVYKSCNAGVMHACGHDVHTASLLGAAKILNTLKGELEGTIKLIFQPGEERLPGGAKLMIAAGALQNPTPSQVIGQHVFPELAVGKVGFRKGMYMASADEIYITIKGTGGHAALPHLLIDPVLISAHLIVALQQIVSRGIKADVPAVLTIGRVIADGATNIVPNEVKLEGTFRTMDEEWRVICHDKITKLCTDLVSSMGGQCELNIAVGYPFLTNDDAVTEAAIVRAEEYLGKENVVELGLRMTAEDFAYYSQLAPSCFYRLGVRNEEKGIVSNLHTATFDIDEQALETGMGLMAYIAASEL